MWLSSSVCFLLKMNSCQLKNKKSLKKDKKYNNLFSLILGFEKTEKKK